MLTWAEFLSQVQTADVFQYFAEGEKDFIHNITIHDLQGTRCTVIGKGDYYVYWVVEADKDTNAESTWAFYSSNKAESRATYRIVQTQPQLEPEIPPGLADWEKDLYYGFMDSSPKIEKSLAVKAAKEASAALLAKKLKEKGEMLEKEAQLNLLKKKSYSKYLTDKWGQPYCTGPCCKDKF